MEELLKLAKLDGNYQDIEINGNKVLTGWRECDSRWEIIEPYIGDQQVVVDIGSHFGFFTAKVARKFPGNLVWSFEAEERRAQVQQMVLEENNFKNVVLSRYRLEISDLVRMVSSCAAFDTILCLS